MSSQFRLVCFANFFLFFSVYMLLPVLPVEMADKLDMTIASAGSIFLLMVLGKLVSGPFMSYLLETFDRKYLCVTALLITVITTAVYFVVDNPNELYILSFIWGAAFSVATVSMITLGIDITVSAKRSKGNIIFGRLTRTARFLGIALGCLVYVNIGFTETIVISLFWGITGLFLLLWMRIPFRAPMGAKLLSLDRFLLPVTWPLALNLVLFAIVPGMMLPLVHFEISNLIVLNRCIISYPVVVAAAFLLSSYVARYNDKADVKTYLLSGLTLLVLSLSCFMLFDGLAGKITSAVLFGVSLALVVSPFLKMFIDLSSHCERASANTTNLFAWGVGLPAGIAVSCYLKDNYSSLTAYQSAAFFATVALVCFILFSYTYYQRKKVR